MGGFSLLLSREIYKYKSGMKRKKMEEKWIETYQKENALPSLLLCSSVSSMVTSCLGNQMFSFFLYASPTDGSIRTFLCT